MFICCFIVLILISDDCGDILVVMGVVVIFGVVREGIVEMLIFLNMFFNL